jgi:hypothetical protein
LLASPRICQGLWLDQQTEALVAATGPAEAHDDGISGALGFRAPCERGIARWQILEIIKANAA